MDTDAYDILLGMEFIASCGAGMDSQFGEFFWRVDYQYCTEVPHMRASLPMDYHMRYDVPEDVRHAHYSGEVWEAADLMDAQLGDESSAEELEDPPLISPAFAATIIPISPSTPHISRVTRHASLLRRATTAARLTVAMEGGLPPQEPRTRWC